MRIGKYHIYTYWHWRRPIEAKQFLIDFAHKYWYLWDAYFDMYFFALTIEICRTDWNKCYKDKCENYTEKCRHCMDCNQCKDCYDEKES